MDVSATSTRMSKLTSDHKPLLVVDQLEASNLHSNVAKNKEISIAIKEDMMEEMGECDLDKEGKESNRTTNDDRGKETEEGKVLEGDCADGQPEMDLASSDKSGLLTTHL